jgi:hypothetical protein
MPVPRVGSPAMALASQPVRRRSVRPRGAGGGHAVAVQPGSDGLRAGARRELAEDALHHRRLCSVDPALARLVGALAAVRLAARVPAGSGDALQPAPCAPADLLPVLRRLRAHYRA